MSYFFNISATFVNIGVITGFVMGGLLLLRPILLRILSPQQRVMVWTAGWLTAYMPSWYGMASLLSYWFPVGFRGWFTPRTDSLYRIPAYLPTVWSKGSANLALPGGTVIRMDSFYPVLSLLVIYVVGVVVAIWVSGRQTKSLLRQTKSGQMLTQDDRLGELLGRQASDVCVHICPHLRTSFLTGQNKTSNRRYNIYLQQELPRQQMELVLLHETAHIRLHHIACKSIASMGCCLHWWNPLVWLGFRYFCQDLELACDRRVLAQLDQNQRADYAQTLLDLAGGKPLLDVPLAFGEADAALRIRQAVSWKKPPFPVVILTWGAAVLLLLFFTVSPMEVFCQEDKELAWSVYLEEHPSFLSELGTELQESGVLPQGTGIEDGWYRVEPVDGPSIQQDQVTIGCRLTDGRFLSTYYWWFGVFSQKQPYRFLPSGNFSFSPVFDFDGFSQFPPE